MMAEIYRGRVGLQQRVLPSYRALFLDTLARSCSAGLSVFAGLPLSKEGISPIAELQVGQLVRANNRYFRDPGSPFFMCWQAGFIRWLESWQPDVLIVEANPRYFTTPHAVDWMHRQGKKVIGWGLGAPSTSGLLGSFRRWERVRLLQSMDALIAYSQQGAEQYRQLGFPADRLYVASNAVNPAPVSPPPLRAERLAGKASLLFVGRLQPRKRVDLLLRACAALPLDLQPSLVIVGDGPARRALEDLAAQVFPKAEFCGEKQGSELELYYEQADLFILPGTGGLAVQQAMAHALPVIVARGDGTQDDLVRSENGWLVVPDDLEGLTEAIRLALANRLDLQQKGRASYRIVADEINVDKMVEVFIRALLDLGQAPSVPA